MGKTSYQWIASRKWAMSPDGLRALVDAARDANDTEFAAYKGDAHKGRERKQNDALEQQAGAPMKGAQLATVREGRGGKVAVIPAYGPLMRHDNFFSWLFGGSTYAAIAQDLRLAMDDSSIKSILLDIDSPGGEVNGTAELSQQIIGARAAKPVIAYSGYMAASAGYWMASAASPLVLHKTAQVGSIGVMASVYSEDDEPGVHRFVSSQSPLKNPDPTSKEGKSEYQTEVDALASFFISDVAANRGVDEDTVLKDFGKGGVKIGQGAVDAGMADGLGNFEELIGELTGGAKGRKIYVPSANKSATKTQGASKMEFTPEQIEAMVAENARLKETEANAVKMGADIQALRQEA